MENVHLLYSPYEVKLLSIGTGGIVSRLDLASSFLGRRVDLLEVGTLMDF